MLSAPRPTPAPPLAASEPEDFETDEDLGIGEEDAPAAPDDPMAALLANPAFAAAVDLAVARRLGGATPQAAGGALDANALAHLAASIEKIATVHASQQPGYAKPLPAVEIERRASAFEEMNALIDLARLKGEPPNYQLVEEPLFAGEYLFPPGSKIRGYIIPNEHMLPLDERGKAIHRAFMQWIGGPTEGIAEQVYNAERARNGTIADPTPFRSPTAAHELPVEMVEPPSDTREFDPRRPPTSARDRAQDNIVHTIA